MQSRSPYTLDQDGLSDALSILAGEITGLKELSRVQSMIIPRLIGMMYAAFLSLAVIGMLWNHDWIYAKWAVVLGVIIYAAYVVASFYFGWGEMRAWSSLRMTEAQLGLPPTKYISPVGWKEFLRRLPLISLVLLSSCLLVVLFVWSEVYSLSRWIFDVGILACAIVQALSTKSLMFRNARMPREVIEAAEHLRDRLLKQQKSSMGDKNQAFQISEEEYKQIAGMERALINLDRKRAIEQSNKKSERVVRAVQQSPEVLRKKSTLLPLVRLRIQTQIDELSTEPRPPAAYEYVDGTWRLPVPETSLEIKYVLAENTRHIMVDDLVDSIKQE